MNTTGRPDEPLMVELPSDSSQSDARPGDRGVVGISVQPAGLADVPATAADMGFDSVDAMFRRAAADMPDAIACRDGDGSYSYRYLDAWAGQVAEVLRAAGCRRGDPVPVNTTRDAGLLAAVLGVIRAGGTYVPIDPRSPQARNLMVYEELDAALMIGEATVGTPFRPHEVLRVDACRPSGKLIPRAEVSDPADVAYVLFTSGSTGRPKGVRVGHAALAHTMAAVQTVVQIRPGETCLALTTPSFDIAALEWFLPLCYGAEVEIVPAEEARDPSAIASRLDRPGRRATLAQATPTMWRAIVEAGWRGRENLRILCGGEELAADLANELVRRTGRAWNVYGPTETTIWSTFMELGGRDDEAVPIGRPFPGERVYVVDEQGNAVPPGVVGELWIGGATVAEGYLNRPELTDERFGPDPFAASGRIYRTGDLAEFRPNGTLLFCGRRDSQVKLRGHRIELGEIESVLRRDDGVSEAVVVVQGDNPLGHKLVAFVVPASDSTLHESDLLARCASHLPPVMVPSACRVIPAWPTTASGKIDRNALRRIDVPSAPAASDGSVHRRPLEALIARTFAAVLRLNDVPAAADFFELGGHSMLAHQVIVQLRAAGIQVALRDLFEAPSVARLADRIQRG